jgi:hypothetical protein
VCVWVEKCALQQFAIRVRRMSQISSSRLTARRLRSVYVYIVRISTVAEYFRARSTRPSSSEAIFDGQSCRCFVKSWVVLFVVDQVVFKLMVLHDKPIVRIPCLYRFRFCGEKVVLRGGLDLKKASGGQDHKRKLINL